MIVLEGPDGAGKTTLLEKLSAHYPSIPIHTRASDGVNGPVKSLFDWTQNDMQSWRQGELYFYDRHPLISEYIYGPVVRGHIDPRFHTTAMRRRFAQRALVIVCLPPLDAVRASVSDERDMPGVATHIDTIWQLYASLRAQLPTTGHVHYDWTEHKPEDLFGSINSHKTYWSVTKP